MFFSYLTVRLQLTVAPYFKSLWKAKHLLAVSSFLTKHAEAVSIFSARREVESFPQMLYSFKCITFDSLYCLFSVILFKWEYIDLKAFINISI